MIQSGHLKSREKLDLTHLKKILFERFKKINFEQAKSDIEPFIKDNFELNIWSQEFFNSLVKKIS